MSYRTVVRACAVGVAMLLTPALAACDLSTAPRNVPFVVHVDSITGPTTAATAARPFDVGVWARIGPNGCHQFTGFETAETESRLDVTVRGTRPGGGDIVCPQNIVELRGQPLRVQAPAHGPYTIAAHQPDGSVLTYVVNVE